MHPYKTIKKLLEKKDFNAFLEFVKTEYIYELEEGDEYLLYKKGPLKWQKELLQRIQPYSKSERQIFKNGNLDMILMLISRYDVSRKNLVWGFANMDLKKLRAIARKTNPKQSANFEIALINCANEDLFKIWLDKVPDLQPASKDFLRDTYAVRNLRTIYNRRFPEEPI